MIVAIDGPAGAGKSTAAKALAQRLGFEFLDTGAMYRAVAWSCLSTDVKLDDVVLVAAIAGRLKIEFAEHHILCDGRDVTQEIRTAESSAAASVVAAIPAVRHEMVRLQRAAAEGRDVVTEGRDQGSVVFPDAECKVFLTADAVERAERRQQELEQRGFPTTLDRVLAEIHDRDHRDKTRADSPLVMATDAVYLDSSALTIAEVVAHILQIVATRMASDK